MSRIRSRDTIPERKVRSLLHRRGFRFRKNVKSLPGAPDIVLRKFRAVVFVHGCFWHQHKGCKRATMPKENAHYWEPKLKGNVERDFRNKQRLEELGWKVFIVWECETSDLEALSEAIRNARRVSSK